MSSLPITFALFALSAAENASVNRNKNLIAGSHRINNSGEEIIQYKRGGQMAVAPHGVLKENSQLTEGCMNAGKTKMQRLNCFCSSEGRTPPETRHVTYWSLLEPGGWEKRGGWFSEDVEEYPKIFLKDNKMPTSFNIPRIVEKPDLKRDLKKALENNDHVFDIRNPKFFQITRSHVEFSEDEVKLSPVLQQNEAKKFVYLPYVENKITCINMADFPKLAVLSDQFTGCWMNTVKSDKGVLERVCHVGTVVGDNSMNNEWNNYVGKLGGNKEISGFKPADCVDALCAFASTQNGKYTAPEYPKSHATSLDTMGIVSDDQMYTLVVPRGPTGGHIQSIPTSYLLRRMINTLREFGEMKGKIDIHEDQKKRIARIEISHPMK